LVLRYRERVFALACRMTGDRAVAEDLAQETFLKAFQKLPEFEQRSAFFT
jgi:RNA polymerase sigma-70 factor, ECF subfamily